MPCFTGNVDSPTVILNVFQACRQSHPRTVRTGRKKRLENLLAYLFRNSRPLVRAGRTAPAPLPWAAHADCQRSPREFHASVITNRQNSWPPGKNFIGVLLGASRKAGLTVSRLAERARCLRSQGRSPRPRVSAVRFGVQALACYGHRAA